MIISGEDRFENMTAVRGTKKVAPKVEPGSAHDEMLTEIGRSNSRSQGRDDGFDDIQRVRIVQMRAS